MPRLHVLDYQRYSVLPGGVPVRQFCKAFHPSHSLGLHALGGICYTVICHCLPISHPIVSGVHNNQVHAFWTGQKPTFPKFSSSARLFLKYPRWLALHNRPRALPARKHTTFPRWSNFMTSAASVCINPRWQQLDHYCLAMSARQTSYAPALIQFGRICSNSQPSR